MIRFTTAFIVIIFIILVISALYYHFVTKFTKVMIIAIASFFPSFIRLFVAFTKLMMYFEQISMNFVILRVKP